MPVVKPLSAAAVLCTVVAWPALTAWSAPVVYTDEAAFLAELNALGLGVVHESFEDGQVWAASRNSIVEPGSTPTVTSQGVVWTSNYAQNRLATGSVGGSAPDGDFAIYSLPHGLTTDSGLYCDSAEEPDIPEQCFQNDGLAIAAADGGMLFAFGGRIDTANGGKVTFLLDGLDINGNDGDNIGNWQREGDAADNWQFVGVIDAAGFQTAELRELRGKDYQQVLLFADDFTVSLQAATLPDADGDGVPDGQDFYPNISLGGRPDTDHDGIPDDCDAQCILLGMSADTDDDGDGFIDEIDNCPLVSNPDQADVDGDGIGDACDLPPGCG